MSKTKEKKSFFERLTGIQKIEKDEQEEIVNFREENSSERDFFADSTSSQTEQPYQQEYNYEVPQPEAQTPTQPQPETYNEPAPLNNQTPVTPPTSTPVKNETENETEPSDAEGQLTIDVYQTDDDVVIKSTIAGVKPENLDVNINNDMVTIRGERVQDEEIDPENYYYQECYWGTFSRSVILPIEIIPDKAEATMKNGILTLRMPKADTTKTRKIQVRGY